MVITWKGLSDGNGTFLSKAHARYVSCPPWLEAALGLTVGWWSFARHDLNEAQLLPGSLLLSVSTTSPSVPGG